MKDGIQYILYNLPEEQGEVQVVVENETLWCTQKAMAQLFGVGVPAISMAFNACQAHEAEQLCLSGIDILFIFTDCFFYIIRHFLTSIQFM